MPKTTPASEISTPSSPHSLSKQKNSAKWGDKTVEPVSVPDKQLEQDSGYETGPETPPPLLSRKASKTSFDSTSSPANSDSEFRFDTPAPKTPLSTRSHPLSKATTINTQKPLGAGSYSTVFKVTMKTEDGKTQHFALKVLKDSERLEKEQSILEQLKKHPNIAKYYGVVKVDGQKGLLFDCIDDPSLITLNHKLCEAQIPVDEYINAQKYLEQQKLSAAAVGESGAPFLNGARTDDLLYNQRVERSFRIFLKMQEYIKPKEDGSYIQPATINPESIQEKALKTAQRFMKSSDEETVATAARGYEKELLLACTLINDLMHPNPQMRIPPDAAINHHGSITTLQMENGQEKP